MIFYRDRFKKLRELRGMTMTDFAKQASVTKQCIEQWEKGNLNPELPNSPDLQKYSIVKFLIFRIWLVRMRETPLQPLMKSCHLSSKNGIC